MRPYELGRAVGCSGGTSSSHPHHLVTKGGHMRTSEYQSPELIELGTVVGRTRLLKGGGAHDGFWSDVDNDGTNDPLGTPSVAWTPAE